MADDSASAGGVTGGPGIWAGDLNPVARRRRECLVVGVITCCSSPRCCSEKVLFLGCGQPGKGAVSIPGDSNGGALSDCTGMWSGGGLSRRRRVRFGIGEGEAKSGTVSSMESVT